MSQNCYAKISNYIVSLKNIHGVLNNSRAGLKSQVIVTYCDGISACLDFDTPEEAVACFDKIGDALGAV